MRVGRLSQALGDPRQRFVAGVALSALIVALLLLTGSDYLALLLATSGVYAVTVTGLNFLTGTSGQLSFGHNTFLAVGAYGTAIVLTRSTLSPWLATLAAVVLAGALATVVAYPITRLRGHYLSMATLALGLATYEIIANVSFTNGFVGMSLPRPLILFGLSSLAHPQAAIIVWLVVLLAVWSLFALRRSRFGKALEAARDNEDLAIACGLNVPLLRLGAFVISALYAAAGGALLAFVLGYISPELFSVDTIATLFMMMYLGGTGGLFGVLVSTFVITALPQELSPLATWEVPIFGTLLLAYLVLRQPIQALWRRLRASQPGATRRGETT